jgi:hypothetical protein
MTPDDFEVVLSAFNRRRPFRSFLIELHSGDRLHAQHPEAVRRLGDVFALGQPDFGNRVFSSSAVSQVIDLPPPPAGTPPGTASASPP